VDSEKVDSKEVDSKEMDGKVAYSKDAGSGKAGRFLADFALFLLLLSIKSCKERFNI